MLTRPKSFNILSMDAGGIAGLVTARLLQRIVDRMPDFLNDVYLIAGTSAGAVNALILAQHDDPVQGLEACVRLWQEPKLLSNTPWGTLLATWGLRPFISFDNYRAILARYIDPALTLGDLKHHVLITSFNLLGSHRYQGDWHPDIINSWREAYRSFSALDAALRASAAPALQAIYQGHIDGGIFNASPSMSALAETALQLRETQADGTVLLLSVGCGMEQKQVTGLRQQQTPWGYLQWLVPSPLNAFTLLGTLLLNAQEEIANDNLEQFSQRWPQLAYWRLEPRLRCSALAYNIASLSPVLRRVVIDQLEAVIQTRQTQTEIDKTIDWLYQKGWSGQASETTENA